LIRKGEWNKATAGGLFSDSNFWKTRNNNPQYSFVLKEDNKVVISLHQKDERYINDNKIDNHCIGFHILSVNDKNDRVLVYKVENVVAKSKAWKFDRESSIGKLIY
jgi:hypothetical protein